MENSGKTHVSVTVCGHVDAGKSTTTGRLIYELGGISDREMKRLQDEADAKGKSSFAFAFYMDTQKEEQERGVTIKSNTKEFFTDSKHFTIIDSPGHRDYIKNMITGSSQADVALVLATRSPGEPSGCEAAHCWCQQDGL
jgi:elongation factor 1-alpha